MSRIIEAGSENLDVAAAALASGSLVAIPTETVYGLGGNALIESAVKRIYEVKGRPSTDPLICHVNCLEKACQLWDPNWDQSCVNLATTLGRAIWPGPLTIVGKANITLPPCVTGDSGFVGVRIPNHSVTLDLLSRVSFPVAAPSANTFGHVSPTSAQHVYDDLASRDPNLLILDGGSCEIGIESTVVKIHNDTSSVEILRRGKISVSDIQRALASTYPNTSIVIRDTRSIAAAADVSSPMDGPGQLLTHYSPGIPASLIAPSGMPPDLLCSTCAVTTVQYVVQLGDRRHNLSQTVVLDYNGILSCIMKECLAYCDLSSTGDVSEACRGVFEALRWSEKVEGAACVIFPLISEWEASVSRGATENGDLLAAVEDRLFRAASGTLGRVSDNNKS